MNSNNYAECNIPVLTDVISRDDQIEPISDDVEDSGETISIQSEPELPIESTINHDLSLEELEKTLHENVLNQLLTRIDFVLEHRVRDSLADALQIAVDDLAKDIRQGLKNSLEEIIQRAINQELSKLQSLKAVTA